MTAEEITNIRKGLRAIIDQLPIGERAYVEPCLNKVVGCLSRGQLADARACVATYPCPTATLQDAQSAALAALDALLSQQA